MTLQAKMRAEQVAEMPHVQRWIKRFEKLAASMPPEVEVFVAAGTPVVMALSRTKESFLTSDGPSAGMDRDAEVDCIHGGRWESGDF